MSTLANSNYRKKALHYLYVSIVLFLLTVLYEQFGHGVSSVYMRVSILVPLFGGSLVSLLTQYCKAPTVIESSLWKMALTTLTVGLFLQGIFDIAGSYEPLVYVYYYISGFSIILSIILYLRMLTKSIKS